jgi:protease I
MSVKTGRSQDGGNVLSGKKVIVLAEDLYEDLELWYPVLRLREAGAKVTIVGTGAKEYRGKHGYPVEADTSINDVRAGDFDALVVPGGYAPDRLRRYQKVLDLVREMNDAGKPIGAICHAPWVLISAGVLRHRKLTCFHSIKDDVRNAGGEYMDSEVVRDANLVTSRQPSDLGAFCRELIVAVEG